MKVLFLTKYSHLGGSSRHTVFSYLPFYEQAGMRCVVSPLFDDRYFRFRALQHPLMLREMAVHADYFLERALQRMGQVFQAQRYDLVVLEYELLPYLPFGFEVILKRLRPKLVTLFDDAVHTVYAGHPRRLVRLMCGHKIQQVIQLSARVIVWNKYLAEYASRFNPNVAFVHTAIDVRRYRLRCDQDQSPDGRVVIGWMGTPNSFPYLSALEDVFRNLVNRHPLELRVVSSLDYQSSNIPVSNRRWSMDSEVDALCSFDIGIMPLADTPWTRGKSSYKAVQYMGVGIPLVCSPVGAAGDIVQDGVNGFWAATSEQWIEKLDRLIENPELRRRQGLAGRQLVEEKYSVQAVAPRLVKILKELE